jgi:hypothetical protein
MTTAHEIRNLIEQTTTRTHHRRVPKEVKLQVRRYAERRRAEESQGEPARAEHPGGSTVVLAHRVNQARGGEPRGHLGEAARRAIRNPGTVALAPDLK